MLIETFPVAPLGCNCTIIGDPETGSAIVIDPGGEFEKIQAKLAEHKLTVKSIVHTHTHIDHVGATAPLQAACSVSAKIHEADRFLYDMLPVQASMLGIEKPAIAQMDGDLVDNGVVRAGDLELGVIHTPGHTPGSVCFLLKTSEGQVAFTGDTLFRFGIGRTDLWGGDSNLIMKSLMNRLLNLDEETIVIPGHGPASCIADERRGNPFLRG